MNLPPLFSQHFPTYIKDTFNNGLHVFWYHHDFSQSRYPPGQEISEACTLICLLVAQRISQSGLLICEVGEGCEQFNIIMAQAMLEGNATHARIIKEKLVPHPYLNIDEALKFGGKRLNLLREWKFRVFHENIERHLFHNISNFLYQWYDAPRSRNLFVLLITCGRTVLFIFQERTYMVTFFDSHSHNSVRNPNRGLVVAQTTVDKLEVLCNWYSSDILSKCYNTKAAEYELAFLYPVSSHCRRCNLLSECGTCLKKTHKRFVQ